MALYTNLSHWVCVLVGLLLVVSGVTSHGVHTARASLRAGATEHDSSGILKRAVLISIGLLSIAYGVSRIVVVW